MEMKVQKKVSNTNGTMFKQAPSLGIYIFKKQFFLFSSKVLKFSNLKLINSIRVICIVNQAENYSFITMTITIVVIVDIGDMGLS